MFLLLPIKSLTYEDGLSGSSPEPFPAPLQWFASGMYVCNVARLKVRQTIPTAMSSSSGTLYQTRTHTQALQHMEIIIYSTEHITKVPFSIASTLPSYNLQRIFDIPCNSNWVG